VLQYRFVSFQLQSGEYEKSLSENILFRPGEVKIVMVFNVALPVYFEALFKLCGREVIAAMEPFEKDGVIIFAEVPEQLFRPAAEYDIRLAAQHGKQTCFPRVVIYFDTVFVELRCRFPVVFKTMEMDLHPGCI